MKRNLIIALTLGCLLLFSSCSSRKAPTATVPATPGAPLDLAQETHADPVSAEAEHAYPEELVLIGERVTVPPLRPGAVIEPTGPAVLLEEPPAESAPTRAPQRPRSGGNSRLAGPEQSAESEAAATENRPPSLKPMMSEQERQQLLSQTQAHLERARRNLAGIQATRLDANERDALRQARSFLARAEQLRREDPALASSLAERAAILSQELLRRQR